jgi:hypothetical protein
MWAFENKKKQGDAVVTTGTPSIADFLKGGALPTCPADGSAYTVTSVGHPPACPNAALGHTL